MYRRLVRPLLFLLPAETAHHLGLWALQVLSALPGLCRWLRRRALRGVSGVELGVEVAGMRLEHPLALAAGFDKDATAVPGLFAMGFSAVEVGTVTPRPQPGNPMPRMFRLPEHAALINRLGFNNQGAAEAVKKLDAWLDAKWSPGPVGANLGKNKDTPLEGAVADYLACAEALAPRADYVVVNASSPNTPGLRRLQEPEALGALLAEVKRAAAGKPVFLKIAPDLPMEAVDEIVEVAVASGADGLIATNTTVERPVVGHPLASEAGGLSGAPLAAQALAVVVRAAARARGRLALIASGGVMTAEDAYRRVRAGASVVQLYTGFIYGGPGTVPRLLKDLAALLRRDGFSSVTAAIGADVNKEAGAVGAVPTGSAL